MRIQTMKVFLLIICAISLTAIGCNKQSTASVDPFAKARLEIQGMIPLSFAQRPKTASNLDLASSYREPLDADSVEMYVYRNDTSYHPVSLSHRCHTFIGTYYATKDTTFLRRAERYMRKLMAVCHKEGGALYAPYMMRYKLHSSAENQFEPPWYSGMAQGEMLSVLSRLYYFTDNPEYLLFAERVFESFLRPREPGIKWTVRLDDSMYYWIEEYPHEDNPGMTLNGFVSAVYGIYEYYLVSRDDQARKVYDMSLTTLKHYLPDYLRGDEGSYYCLGHLFHATNAYHSLHVRQMRELYQLTGDQFFSDMAEEFAKRSADGN